MESHGRVVSVVCSRVVILLYVVNSVGHAVSHGYAGVRHTNTNITFINLVLVVFLLSREQLV